MKPAAICDHYGMVSMRRQSTHPMQLLAAYLVMGLLFSQPSAWAKGAKAPATEPDYTKGEKPYRTDAPLNLGPTGASGDMWGKGGDRSTRDTRMIRINSVEKGSPADGVLKPDDVILGVISPLPGGSGKSDVRFTDDCRRVMADAITEAEKKEHHGQLVLNIWREGKIMPANLNLAVKGSFSETAPYECEKTKILIEDAAQAILKEGFFNNKRNSDEETEPRGGISNYTDGLGLLATGEKKYLPKLETYARAVAKGSEKLDIYGGEGCHLGTWHAAYRNLFLTEYFLATKDPQVLPGIKALSMYISLGQSGVGTWSHGMAEVSVNGLYGPPCAYGSMNSASVPCAISLMLAQKCGIKEEPIDQAVIRSLNFFRWYTDKGIPPYGDHEPKLDHDNNGKGSMTAVLFDLAGEEAPARYFTRCTLASYNTRETGHTGNFFSMTWGAPGAARGGPLAAQSFTKNTRWMTEFERHYDGSARYQYQIPDDKKNYQNYSTAGVRLMQYCAPLKAIHMTGKGGCMPPMSAEEVREAAAAATYDPTRRSAEELLQDLASWSPVVRDKAAAALGEKDDNVVEQLIAMLDSPNPYARYGACDGIACAGRESEKAVHALIEKIRHDDDLTMRFFAVNALKLKSTGGRDGTKTNSIGKAVIIASDALLMQAAVQEPVKDPMRKLHSIIASTLFHSGRGADYSGYFSKGNGLEKVDRKLLIPAIKSLLANPNGGARSEVAGIFNNLSEEDLKPIYGDIYLATKKRAPSGVMFSVGIRNAGAILLSEKQFEEALPLALDLYYQDGWGAFSRVPAALEALSNFGSKLKPHMAKITEKYEPFSKRGGINTKKFLETWDKLQKNLEQEKELKSIRPYLEAGGFDPSILD